MSSNDKIQLFEDKRIRTAWDEENEEWYFSVVDVVAVLTESVDPQAYWRKLKQRLKAEGNETVTNCHGFSLSRNPVAQSSCNWVFNHYGGKDEIKQARMRVLPLPFSEPETIPNFV